MDQIQIPPESELLRLAAVIISRCNEQAQANRQAAQSRITPRHWQRVMDEREIGSLPYDV